jgi:pyridoxal phosphate enzyme (YggS family)
MNIADNIKEIRGNIAAAAIKAGADPSSISLVAASKTKDAACVRQAVLAGVDAVGENRVNELIQKKAQGAYEGVPLHFIGHLQRNKSHLITGTVDLIQSVASRELLDMVSRQAEEMGITQDILIQVNIGMEASKSGIEPAAVKDIIAYASSLKGVRVRGLMAIPPVWNSETQKNYVYFDEMYKLFVDIRTERYDNIDMKFLSMGMSGDYTAAIEAGANMIRIGSAIFGGRY